jgi:hypothetical protein
VSWNIDRPNFIVRSKVLEREESLGDSFLLDFFVAFHANIDIVVLD